MKKLVLAVILMLSTSVFGQTKEKVEKCVEKKEKETGRIEKAITTRETREKVHTRECVGEGMRESRERKEKKEKG